MAEGFPERYSRQLPIIGKEGQDKLRKATITIIGVGGLGGIVSYYLVSAGIKHLKIVDGDRVEESNLNRQILYSTDDIGKVKVEVAAEKLKRINPDVVIEPYHTLLSEDNVEEIIDKSTLVIDALDKWSSRFILNKACVEKKIPLIHGGIEGLLGQLIVIIPGKTPCLKCVLPKKPPEKRGLPILGPTPGIIGSMQALEAIKFITGIGKIQAGMVILFNGYNNEIRKIPIRRNSKCPICGGINKHS